MRSALLCTLLVACAPDLAPDDTDTDTDTYVDAPGTLTVDATDASTWTYVDLESGAVVTPGDPGDSDEWDLGFKRSNVKINGGVSGTGDMVVAIVEDAAYDDITTAVDDDTFTDEADADDDGNPEYALGGWYAYDEDTHVLTPYDLVYTPRTVEGNWFKLQFLTYYSDSGTSAMIRIAFADIDPPEGT